MAKKHFGHHHDKHHTDAHPNKHHEHMGGHKEHHGSKDGHDVMCDIADHLNRGNAGAHTSTGKRGADTRD